MKNQKLKDNKLNI